MNIGRATSNLVLVALMSASLAAGLTAAVVRAQSSPEATSAIVPYHGYLEEEGAPAEGARFVTFRLYRTASGGAPVWTESQMVSLSAGRFVVNLGAEKSLDSLLLQPGGLYLELSVDHVEAGSASGKPVDLTGRQLLGSVPFARRGAPGRPFTTDYLVVAPQAQPDEGGELRLQGAGSFPDLELDNHRGSFRVLNDGKQTLEISPTGDASVTANLTVSNNATVGADLDTNNLNVRGAVSGSMRAFGGLYQADDCRGCIYGNPYSSGCACPTGFTGLQVARIWHPETKCGSNLMLCTR